MHAPVPPGRSLLAITAILFATSCNRPVVTKTVPASTAYSDGFEVVVYDTDAAGTPTNIRSLPLRDAERAVASGARALLPSDPTPIEQALSTLHPGDFHVYVRARQLSPTRQAVNLSFHYSNRTYAYEYVVDGTKVTPTASSHGDLGGSESVKYVAG